MHGNVKETKIDLVLKSKVIYPVVCGLKPKKTEVAALGSSLFLLAIKVLEKHRQPNTLKDSISYIVPCSFS